MTVSCDAASGSGYLLTALAFGLVIVAMAYSIGNVSGCHINPAVSIGMLVAGKMSVKDFVGYVVAQFVGATAGALFLKVLFDMTPVVDKTGAFGSNALAGGHIGMSKEFLEHVFEPFTRAETATKSGVTGSGLGMAITKSLVDVLGGTIDIESELGVGTTVRVEFENRIAEPVEAKDRLTEAAPIGLEGKKILLVEDNELNREIATEILK